MIKKILQGDNYFMFLFDDYIRMVSIDFLKNKPEAFGKFKISLVENETNLKIKCLRSYNGGEFTLIEFKNLCEQNGIKRQYCTTNTPQHDGIT